MTTISNDQLFTIFLATKKERTSIEFGIESGIPIEDFNGAKYIFTYVDSLFINIVNNRLGYYHLQLERDEYNSNDLRELEVRLFDHCVKYYPESLGIDVVFRIENKMTFAEAAKLEGLVKKLSGAMNELNAFWQEEDTHVNEVLKANYPFTNCFFATTIDVKKWSDNVTKLCAKHMHKLTNK